MLFIHHGKIKCALVATQIVVLTKILKELIQPLLAADGMYHFFGRPRFPPNTTVHEFSHTGFGKRGVISVNEVQRLFRERS